MDVLPNPSVPELTRRLRDLVPNRWFPDEAPTLTLLLTGLATAWSRLFDALAIVRAQARIATATGSSLDLVAQDFFGDRLLRSLAQSDNSFRAAIGRELLRTRATRSALQAAVMDLTGNVPSIFEPTRPLDTGAWGLASGYGVAGRWGSLNLPFQCFVDIRLPVGAGIAQVAGWNVGSAWGRGPADASQRNLTQAAPLPPFEYAGLGMLQGQVDAAQVNGAIAAVLPAGTIAWVRATP